MLKSMIIAIVGIVFLMVFWLLIQFYWGRAFGEYMTDDDVLSDRMTCGNCGCSVVCKRPDNNSSNRKKG